MRLAVLADIHGNLPAFEAVLDHISHRAVDQIILAGDLVVGAPDSAACWQLAQSLACPMLRGNHERYIAHYGTGQAAASWNTPQYAPVQWAWKQFHSEERQQMGCLPLTLRLPEAPDVVFVHASLRSDQDNISSHTPESELAAMFPDAEERFLIRAHNHVGQVRLWEDRFLITNGSVGLALDGHPTAQYLLLEQHRAGWRFQHQSVPYDVQAVVRRFYDTGYLAETGVMGRLFLREVVTATQQVVPFLRAYAHWAQETPLSLEAAFTRFLSGDWR